MGLNILIVLGINLLFGFTFSGIDNAGHIGGLVGGFFATAVVHFPKKKRPIAQISSAVLSAVLIVAAVQYSSNHPEPLVKSSQQSRSLKCMLKMKNMPRHLSYLTPWQMRAGFS